MKSHCPSCGETLPDGHHGDCEEKFYTYHMLVQNPEQPLDILRAHGTLTDQSRGQAELTELVDKKFNRGERTDHVVIRVHPANSLSWECCDLCNDIVLVPSVSVDLTPDDKEAGG